MGAKTTNEYFYKPVYGETGSANAVTFNGCLDVADAEIKTNTDARHTHILNKLDATEAPGVGDDSADGYSVGSRWLDVTNDKAYVCLDATEGAAVWTETTQSGGAGNPKEIAFCIPGNAYVTTKIAQILVGENLDNETISKVKIYADTAPTDAALIVDVNKNGTTIFTTQNKRPEIAAAAHADDSDTPDVTAISAGDRLSCDIDQIGSTIAGGNDLLITIVMA